MSLPTPKNRREGKLDIPADMLEELLFVHERLSQIAGQLDDIEVLALMEALAMLIDDLS